MFHGDNVIETTYNTLFFLFHTLSFSWFPDLETRVWENLCSTSQWSGFCMIGTSVMKELMKWSYMMVETWFTIISFNPFLPNVPFWSPQKHQKTKGFLIVSGVSKRNIGKKRVKQVSLMLGYFTFHLLQMHDAVWIW